MFIAIWKSGQSSDRTKTKFQICVDTNANVRISDFLSIQTEKV